LPDGEGRECDRNCRNEGVVVGIEHAADGQARSAGIALVEDDNAGSARRLGVQDLDAEVARPALNQGHMA
jgi:hypothetical protein